MPRVKRGPKRKNRRAKTMELASGFWGMKSRGYRIAKQQVDKALNASFTGRKDRKGDFRRLWIVRINAGARISGLSYSVFMHGMKNAGITLDRKVLSDMAINDPAAFAKLVEIAKAAV